MRHQKWKGSLEDRLTCKGSRCWSPWMASTEASGFSMIALAQFILVLIPLHALFLFLLTSWWNQVHDWPSISKSVCPWGSTSVLVKNSIIFSWQSKNRVEHMHWYHSDLKEGYGANMDDEDWKIDLPLCSSTEMNQLFHSDILVKQHKSHCF